MKNSLLLFVALTLVSSLALAEDTPPLDPAAEYLEAFLAIQDGDAAVQKADWPAANTKFTAAQKKLNEIKAAAPTWNPQMVQFRLRYCGEQVDALAPKLPQKAPPLEASITAPPPPPKPVEPAAPPVTPPAEAVVEVKPATPPPVELPARSAEDLAQIKALREQLTKVEEAAAKASAQTKELSQQNQDLSAQLAEARKQAATPPAPVPPAEDQTKLKELQGQLAKSEADAARARQQADELNKQNRDLSTQLADARKEAAASTTKTNVTAAHRAEEEARIKKLESELAQSEAAAERARRQADELSKQNRTLSAKLAAIPAPATPKTPPTEGNRGYLTRTAADDDLKKENSKLEAELRKVQTELADARKQSSRAEKTTAELKQENKQLTAKLASAPPTTTADKLPPGDSNRGYVYRVTPGKVDDRLQKENATLTSDLQKARAELAKLRATAPKDAKTAAENERLRTELQQTKTDAEQGRKAAAEAQKLKTENQALTAKVSDLQKQASATRTQITPARPTVDTGEVAKLRAELQIAREEADRNQKTGDTRAAELAKQNQQLSAALAAAQKAPAQPRDTDEVRQLRAALAAAKAEAEQAKRGDNRVAALEAQNSQLRAQLAETQKQPPAPREPSDLRKLRGDLDNLQATVNRNAELTEQLRRENSFLKNLLETYAAKNPELKGQLRRMQSAAPKE
jgi:DNA repair exonuclease SbcCD ATPase subunit